MSLCYDGGKRLTITLSIVAISLTVGLLLMQYAHGYVNPDDYPYSVETELKIKQFNAMEKLLQYCYDHADQPNPIQNLVDKGLLSQEYQGKDCKFINQLFNQLDSETNAMITNYTKNMAKYRTEHFCDFVADPNNYPACRSQ